LNLSTAPGLTRLSKLFNPRPLEQPDGITTAAENQRSARHDDQRLDQPLD
jgi:hypothetical protein